MLNRYSEIRIIKEVSIAVITLIIVAGLGLSYLIIKPKRDHV